MSNKKRLFRRSQFEVIEPRRLMAGDLQTDVVSGSNVPSSSAPATTNTSVGPVYLRVTAGNQSSDVNSDGLINHRDAHAVVSFLNARSSVKAEGESVDSRGNAGLDANGDGHVSPSDILWIVNKINEYDPLVPCSCGACTQPTAEGQCANSSIAQAQAASLLAAQVPAPAGEFVGPLMDSLAAAQSVDEYLRTLKDPA